MYNNSINTSIHITYTVCIFVIQIKGWRFSESVYCCLLGGEGGAFFLLPVFEFVTASATVRL